MAEITQHTNKAYYFYGAPSRMKIKIKKKNEVERN